uniref:Uncharacterized protein n=1 Tax=Anguilla anguilla TaxID=7936 RepID=A0A0E9WC79_ANGAN
MYSSVTHRLHHHPLIQHVFQGGHRRSANGPESTRPLAHLTRTQGVRCHTGCAATRGPFRVFRFRSRLL